MARSSPVLKEGKVKRKLVLWLFREGLQSLTNLLQEWRLW